MKVLFIVQGEGRGHMTQAIALENILRENGHEVVEILVGKSKTRELPTFFTQKTQTSIKQFASPNFLPSAAKTRMNMRKSVLYNILKIPSYMASIRFINHRIAQSGADLVVNFYELLTGLTYFFYRPAIPHVCVGHQYLFLHKDFEAPTVNRSKFAILKLFTRLTATGASRRLALSFRRMANDNRHKITVIPPLLRDELFKQKSSQGNYIHGYMLNSGYADSIRRWHENNPSTELRFFWDKKGKPATERVDATMTLHQLNDHDFLHQMAGCMAYATTAGFESVCEAMFLGKPILMVPTHIEQECNAIDAVRNGAGIMADDFDLSRLTEFAKTFHPNPQFAAWAVSAPHMVMNELGSLLVIQHTPDVSIAGSFV